MCHSHRLAIEMLIEEITDGDHQHELDYPPKHIDVRYCLVFIVLLIVINSCITL